MALVLLLFSISSYLFIVTILSGILPFQLMLAHRCWNNVRIGLRLKMAGKIFSSLRGWVMWMQGVYPLQGNCALDSSL
jgi:hypothetical protein